MIRDSKPTDLSLDARQFGATGNGRTLDTPFLQHAIDQCAQTGGGNVLLKDGIFLSGTLRLRSRVTLVISPTAVLRGSANPCDYEMLSTQMDHYYRNTPFNCLIYAEREEDVSLTGGGVIDGQGTLFNEESGLRPFLFRLCECRNVHVHDLLLQNSANWISHYLACENVRIERVMIHSRIRANRDGIDIDSCDGVNVHDCHVYTGDDGIVFKSTVAGRACRNVSVSDCVISAIPAAIKFGTESLGGFENVSIKRCRLLNSRDGIVINEVDGGICEQINISDIEMDQVEVPLFIRLGNRGFTVPGQNPPGVGKIRNITISSIRADNAGKTGCAITGISGYPLENITLRDIRITTLGGGTITDAERRVPELVDKYPKATMFGTLPAYGLYLRHIRGFRLVDVELSAKSPEERLAIILDDDVHELRCDGRTPEPYRRANVEKTVASFSI